jgi:lambda family phage portal protein
MKAPKAKEISARPGARRAAREARQAGAAPERVARGFEAGQTGRRLKAIPSTQTAINSLIRTYGKSVIARSRYLCTNNPYAAQAKRAFTSALVGSGIKPSWLKLEPDMKAALQDAFTTWTDEADADGIQDFYGMQSTIADELFEAGECFVRERVRRPSDGLSVPLQYQILPAEMLPYHLNQSNGRNTIICGIEYSPIGKRVAYWFYRTHPGEQMVLLNLASRELVRVPADEVFHIFKPIRAGQIRGIPHSLSALVTLAITDLYEDAELERKRMAALFGAFTITQPEATDADESVFEGLDIGTNSDGTTNYTLEPGVMADLPPGRDIKFAEPADVGATYEPFLFRMLSRAAAGFGVPYVDMTGDLRQVNYSSDRSGLVRFRRRIEADQHHTLVFQFCRPLINRWLAQAARVGAVVGETGNVLLTATVYIAEQRKFERLKWIPPKWDWVDPLKDRQAEKLAVDSGFKARSDVVEAEGYDVEEVDTRIADDQKRAGTLGIKFVQLPSSIIVSPGEESSIIDDTPAPAPGFASEETEFG